MLTEPLQKKLLLAKSSGTDLRQKIILLAEVLEEVVRELSKITEKKR